MSGFAPALVPLIVGALLLLAVITVLGLRSGSKMEEVTFGARELALQHSARLKLVLDLRLMLTKLDNEARARHEAESRREIVSPFEFRLSKARDDVRNALTIIDNPALTKSKEWVKFRDDLEDYLETTDDLKTYGLKGCLANAWPYVDGKRYSGEPIP